LKKFSKTSLKQFTPLSFKDIYSNKVNLDLLDKVRDHARINSEALKRRVELKHKTKINPQQFKVSDLVMRKAHPYTLENDVM